MTLEGKVAIITGGASGIGLATARRYDELGARVVVGDVRETTEGPGLFVRTDVTRERDCRALMGAAVEQYGRLDVLVTCAGILRGAYTSVDALDDEVFRQVIDVNLRGTYLAVKHAVPHLRRAGGGVILCIASGAGVRGPSSSLAYGASKGGVHGLVMTLEPQLAGNGIRVHAICPGGIATPLKLENVADGARARGESPAAAVERARRELGDPDGVARVLAFLASDDASYVRGTVFTR